MAIQKREVSAHLRRSGKCLKTSSTHKISFNGENNIQFMQYYKTIKCWLVNCFNDVDSARNYGCDFLGSILLLFASLQLNHFS